MQGTVWDKLGRPNRMVCPYSPLSPGGPCSFLEMLQATGCSFHCLTVCHRSDAELWQLGEYLRAGHFGERELNLMKKSGSEVRLETTPEVKTGRFGRVTHPDCIQTLMPEATVISYTNDEVFETTGRLQAGKVMSNCPCVDDWEPSVMRRISSGPPPIEWENFLEGAQTMVVLSENCPVKLGRGRMGKKIAVPSSAAGAAMVSGSPDSGTIFVCVF